MVKGDVFMKIAISGDLGSGISSVSKCLSEKLNFQYLSVGDIFRDFANKKGLTILELNEKAKTDKTIDEGIDLSLRRMANLSENMVIDARLAWYFVKNAFKVYISVDEVVAAKRIMNSNRGNVEKYSSLNIAIDDIRKRSENEIARYMYIYDIKINDMKNYDLVIDSSNLSILEITDKIIDTIEIV